MGTFGDRDSNLRLIGFESYEEYLSSDLWAFIRSRVLASIEDRCECCHSTIGLCLHHRSYSMPVLVGNFSNVHRHIVRLCVECHRAVHSEDGKWFPMDVAEERFQALVGRGYECQFGAKGTMRRDCLPITAQAGGFELTGGGF